MSGEEFDRIRKIGEEEARRRMAEYGVDGERIFDISDKIREIMDTGSSSEIAFLHAMLEAAFAVMPMAYSNALHKEEHEKHEEE